MTLWEWAALALAEDIQEGDHTSLATIPGDAQGKAVLKVKSPGIWCGTDVAKAIFHCVDPHLTLHGELPDGAAILPGDIAFEVHGASRSIVVAERTVLNTLQRMCGIATLTHRMTLLLEGTKARLLDTRKTTPLMRALEKRAVRAGGGVNHRFGLFDMILIKDNHSDFSGGVAHALHAAKAYITKKKLDLQIVVECRNQAEIEAVLAEAGANRLLLDNFSPKAMREAVQAINGRILTEASGGINLANLREYAETGVDFISSGAITHSAMPLDLSLKAV